MRREILLALGVLVVFVLSLGVVELWTANGASDPAKPVFTTTATEQIAVMDRTYCWFAVFTNRGTGLSHTMTTARDKDGTYCPGVAP